ncbi:hypothetical protein C2S53_015767 [Perilla frutescens var. hirtella]|uniref:Zinc finger PHD-type domain-containing protein n=1 Tax=Perilla frutescens var. hirtella TaxID=608512 RepID=A0AAD4JF87_PERFH|nr:hypothetical protein C2S53_015767 [Perilla frutescens var. hirtella]
MSEIKKEEEEVVEEETEDEEDEDELALHHWSHDHPLTLAVTRRGGECYGCPRRFSSGELGYGCKKKSCGSGILLHEECAEMEKKIRHHMHPQHIFIQEEKFSFDLPQCAICEEDIWGLGYYCTSSGCDQFQMHIGCAQDKGDDIIRHRCHPEHELRLLRMCSLRCDACGTKKSGYSYLCTTCEYWIHSRCASLPDTIQREDHHHSLSLSFTVPPEYIEYNYRCEVCHQELLHKYWIYHCHLCRYAVHINCAFKKSPHATTTTSNNENEKNIIRFPMNDVAGEQIRAFVMKAAGIMPPIPDVCFLPMNGLFYGCRRCEFKADINCASLPNTIYHSAHPHHPLNLLNRNDFISKGYYNPWRLQCSAGCNLWQYYEHLYVCDSCDEFMLHVGCALLPPSVRDRRWDKHNLPLTYDANVNHPDEFYCDHCETQMNPKMWMYHCRPCDLSFHPNCFNAASGWYRNIKFGQQYHMNSSGHPHPLTYQLLTTKRSCDVCRVNAYTYRGFHCASCNFFICFYNCIRRKRLEYGDIHAVE